VGQTVDATEGAARVEPTKRLRRSPFLPSHFHWNRSALSAELYHQLGEMELKKSEDVLCRLFAEMVKDSPAFATWVIGHTKFDPFGVRLLHEEQMWRRPNIDPKNWWRHWWRKIPELSQERETDIFLVFEHAELKHRFALHIENKKDAKFSPGQAEDYKPRARWMMGMERYLDYADFQTMLIAPEAFKDANRNKSDLFDCYISYEETAAFIPDFKLP
jgi:hypothetical protein